VTHDTAQPSRSVSLLGKRHEFLAPASALLELSEMLCEDARDLGHPGFLADQEKLCGSARELIANVDEVLDLADGAPAERFASRVRHDLRTPLTHVIGLCELWLEDADELFVERFQPDLRKALSLARRLLASLDTLLDFARTCRAAEPAETAVVAQTPSGVRSECTGTLLVVDDNEVNRDVLLRRLVRDGHTALAAADGRQALELLAARPFDLVLLDLVMPGLGGAEVLRRLKADGRLRHVPVLMISALSDQDSAAHCIEMGAEDYLSRPINPVLLRARISACLEKKRLRDREALHLQHIEQERRRADELLHVILPAVAVRELKATNTVRPRRYEGVAVLFADLVGFTPYCEANSPETVVCQLQALVERWEESAVRHGVQKIKTIGDAFMAAAGLLEAPPEDPVLCCLRCGQEMIAAAAALPTGWQVRVGIDVGPVVAGVLGHRQYLFDLYGDTINTAARMESHGVPGAVTLSARAWARVADRCRGVSCGPVSVKGKGNLEMFRCDGFLEV
jgi:class 3 adenylate cyclase